MSCNGPVQADYFPREFESNRDDLQESGGQCSDALGLHDGFLGFSSHTSVTHMCSGLTVGPVSSLIA